MAHFRKNQAEEIKKQVNKNKQIKNDGGLFTDDLEDSFFDDEEKFGDDFEDDSFDEDITKKEPKPPKQSKSDDNEDDFFDDLDSNETKNDNFTHENKPSKHRSKLQKLKDKQSHKTIKKSVSSLNSKVKSKGKNKKSMIKTTVCFGIIVILFLPIITFLMLQSYMLASATAVVASIVDPQQRAELKAKGELDPDQEATKVPKSILGNEFKDLSNEDDKSNSSSNNQNNSSKKDDDSNKDTTGSGTSDTRKKIIELANSRVEKKIPYSQTNPQSWDDHMDCSGLVQETFKRAGINMTRTTYTQIKECDKISPNEAQEGDLIFFIRGGSPEHVAIYAGNGYLIEEPRPGKTAQKIKVYNGSGDLYYARPKALKDK